MTSIQGYRKKLDQLDADILELIAQRFDITEELGLAKKAAGEEPYQSKRWNLVLENVYEVAEEVGLAKEMVKDIWDSIHTYSLKQQNRIMNTSSSEV